MSLEVWGSSILWYRAWDFGVLEFWGLSVKVYKNVLAVFLLSLLWLSAVLGLPLPSQLSRSLPSSPWFLVRNGG